MLTAQTLRDLDRPELRLPDLNLPDLNLQDVHLADDASAFLRRADVAGRVDTAVDAATDVARSVIGQLPGRRRRRRSPFLVAGLLLGALAVTSAAAWWARRSAARLEAQRVAEEERELDLEAMDRAADEGMTGVSTLPAGGATGFGYVPDRNRSTVTAPVA